MRLLTFTSGLILGLTLSLVGCRHQLAMNVYIIDGPKIGAESYDEKQNSKGFIPITSMDKFVCLSPTDAQLLLMYCESSIPKQ